MKIKDHTYFIEDLSIVDTVLVQPSHTPRKFEISKEEALKELENVKCKYYLDDNIYLIKRNCMVII